MRWRRPPTHPLPYDAAMIRAGAILLALATVVAGPGWVQGADGCETSSSVDASAAMPRTDHRATGNRVAAGCGPLQGSVVDIELGARPTWVLPDPALRGDAWLVALQDGTVIRVLAAERGEPTGPFEVLAQITPGDPLVGRPAADGELVLDTGLDAAAWHADVTPDTRIVEAPSGTQVALTEPTDRYPHGAIGDELEAAAISVREADGEVRRIAIAASAVIEGTSALLADLMGETNGPEILVTVSDRDQGARLVVYGLDGELIAASEPIGQGFRWLHQIGVGPTGPDGEVEIIAVRTPHIGGIVEAYRLVDDRLDKVASLPGFSSHRLGSTNLDMALLADADGDGRLEVVVPTQDMSRLGVLTRTPGGFELLATLPLDGTLATNVAATTDEDGRLVLAAGTNEGRLRILR